eukprot:scaffold10726_cov182-Alexandrium_tamarense.AAC.1
MSRPPPPPPPPGGGSYYSSNAGASSSTAARQRLGLAGKSTTTAGGMMNTTTASSGGAAASSSDDWFASSNPPAPAAAPSSSSGFYSGGGGGDGGGMYGYSGGYGNTSTNNTMNSASAAQPSNYYGYDNSMSGAMGSTSSSSIPPSSAFGSNPNSGSMGQMSGQMGGGGAIGSSPLSGGIVPNVFDPNAAKKGSDNNNNTMQSYDEDYENEPPLLEELGVNFPHIYSKSRAVLFPYGKHAKSLESDVMDDTDLAGPLAFALGLGGELLLSGKMHFGYVYGFGISGWIAMTLLLNLLNPNGAVSMWTVVSILGYALLPVNLLAGINVVLRIAKLGWIGMALAVLTICWCTAASTRLFERGCDMRSQRFLVAYPAALLYSAFVMITIF